LRPTLESQEKRKGNKTSQTQGTLKRRQSVYQPTVPRYYGPTHSEQRAAERREFEIGRRAREEARERAEEEEERKRELAEDEFYKEQRRKAVPIAHPVPDWYASAPKRKKSS